MDTIEEINPRKRAKKENIDYNQYDCNIAPLINPVISVLKRSNDPNGIFSL